MFFRVIPGQSLHKISVLPALFFVASPSVHVRMPFFLKKVRQTACWKKNICLPLNIQIHISAFHMYLLSAEVVNLDSCSYRSRVILMLLFYTYLLFGQKDGGKIVTPQLF